MKKWMYLAMLFFLGIAGCKKDEQCPVESSASAPAAERTVIRDYLLANSINAIEHSSGIFVAIQDSGVGTRPTICNRVVVHYTGFFMQSGASMGPGGSGNNVSFLLSEVIAGWQKGVQLLKPGGRMMLYIPPTMGYGQSDYPSTSNPQIPGGSYLKFDIVLVSVQ